MSRALRGGAVLLLATMLAAAVLAQHASPDALSGAQVWEALATGNQRFVIGQPQSHDIVTQRKHLATTQNPHAAVLSCADSRVPPELVFDQGLGDLFVVRSAGESVDPLSLGSLEYAVAHLGTSVIVVLGHQRCGAVTAACSGEKVESRNLEAVVRPIASSCRMVDPKKPDAIDLAARDHIHHVAEDLLAQSEMLKKAVGEGKLTIVEAFYSLDTGEVTKLR